MGSFAEWRKQRLIEKEWDMLYRNRPKRVKKGRLDTSAPDPLLSHGVIVHKDGTRERWNPKEWLS